MRDIKFRAWDTKFKAMSSPMNLRNGLDFFHFGPSHKGQLIRALASDSIDLMQYTGLHDKNGVEIYEGDIVRRDNTIFLVVWYEYGWHYAWGADEVSSRLHDANMFEVIGNIYENPKLLKPIKV